MNLDDLDSRGGEWLRGTGERADVVFSSRVRLARNLSGYHFLARASSDERREIAGRIKPVLTSADLGRRSYYVDVDASERLLAQMLRERHLISRELESGQGARGVAFGSDEVLSVMVNEEDHLRIQAIQASLALDECYRRALALDLALEADLEFAANSKLGYLTACPTNVGTGLRASVMLHLPALAHMKQIPRVFQATRKTGLTVRGFYGEGTSASGDLYQISNQITLGHTEEEILRGLERMIPNVIQYEDRCREEMLTRGRVKLEDKCHRALAVLRAARTLSSDEAMGHFSAVRLGVVLGLIEDVALETISELFVSTMPAHLQKLEGRPLDAEERDIRRAALVRATLS